MKMKSKVDLKRAVERYREEIEKIRKAVKDAQKEKTGQGEGDLNQS